MEIRIFHLFSFFIVGGSTKDLPSSDEREPRMPPSPPRRPTTYIHISSPLAPLEIHHHRPLFSPSVQQQQQQTRPPARQPAHPPPDKIEIKSPKPIEIFPFRFRSETPISLASLSLPPRGDLRGGGCREGCTEVKEGERTSLTHPRLKFSFRLASYHTLSLSFSHDRSLI